MNDHLRAATVTVAPATPPGLRFADRRAAGRALVTPLLPLARHSDVAVLGLARGGVIVAHEVATGLDVPHDAFVARKLGVPGLPEVAIGAIAEGWSGLVTDGTAEYLGVPPWMTASVEASEREEARRRVARFRGERPLPDLRGRTVILVDDGMASGATMRAAVSAVRAQQAARIVVAVPVASSTSVDELAPLVDELVVLVMPEPFGTVSDWYEHFEDVGDDEVLGALQDPTPASMPLPPVAPAAGREHPVTIPLGDGPIAVSGDVGVPTRSCDAPAGVGSGVAAARETTHGLVIFAHGGGSSRQSYRNRFLAAWLRMRGWTTLRVDLLTEAEARVDADTGQHRFDLPLITERLRAAIDWAVAHDVPGSGRIVLFGASTGAAAALLAAADRPMVVHGVMSRGGRVDLAADAFDRLRIPVLLVVGSHDAATLRWNRRAILRLRGETTFRLVRGAGHVFDEPGTLGAVGAHVDQWLSGAMLDQPGSRSWWRMIIEHARSMLRLS